MKKTLFIGPYSHHLGSKSSLACYRIVRWICNNVEGCHFVQYDDFTKIDCYRNVDNIVYFYSSYYAKFDELINLMKKHPNAKLYWLYNEYTLALNSSIAKFFKQREYEVITNLVEGHSDDVVKTCKKLHIINANVSAFRDEIVPKPFEERPYDLIYYGTYKPDRQQYVNEYYQNSYVSTSAKNIVRFKSNGLSANFIDRLVWGRRNSTLNNFKFSVYVEDKSMHTDSYNHLADRFYECISNRVVLFFDENCKNNVIQSEYEIPDFFFVRNKKELTEKMGEVSNNPDLRNSYLDGLIKNVEKEKETLRNQLRSIL